nr:hypothetical protein HK105_007367 [Polyrhizophydium stewartii]
MYGLCSNADDTGSHHAQTAVVDVALSGSRLLALHASKNPLRQVLRQGETAALLMMLDKRLEEAAKAVGLTPSFGGCSVADAAAKDVSELPQLLQQLGRQLTVTTQRLESLSDIGVVLRSRAAQLPKQIREAMTTLLTALEADLQNKCGRPLAPQRSWSISSDDVRIASHVVIAETALGKVFEASWLGRHALAQMITIPPTPEAIQKVDAEATTWASLCHPNVAQIWGLCLSTDFPFAVLPPSGPSLAALVNERPNADPAMRIHLVLGIAAGMAYLHGLPTPIFHGDLRASNVMLGTSGEAQVAHFAMQETQAITKSLSQVSLAVPSVRWIAPEKYKRGYQRGPADVFAFAMTCCEIFTGRIPFFEEQQDEVVREWIKQNGSGLIIQSQSQIRSDVAAPGTSQAPDKSSQEVLAAGSALPADQASASQDPKSDIEIFTHMFPDWCGRHSVTLSSWKHMGKAVRFSGNEAIMYPSSSLIYKEEDERIVAIRLSNNNLSGEIPPEIFTLVNLRELSLHNNKLTGCISPRIGSLTKLTKL